MTPILIILEPFNPITGTRETIRVASALSAEAFGLEGQQWIPALAQRPVMSIELMSPDLDGRVQAGRCRFSVDLNVFRDKRMARWKWLGAAVQVYSAPDLKLLDTPDFAGFVSTPSLDRDTLILGVEATVDITFLDRPLLTAEFDGSGGLGGEAEKRGTLKPAGFGAVENIPPVWFDTTNWIGMLDGYDNTTAITRLMEGLNDFGAAVGDYADYDALKAAIEADAIPPGRWATCVAQGLVGLGAPPVGPITVNATFGSNRLGSIAQRILSTHALVPGANVDAAAFAALDTAVNRAAHYWTSEQRDVRELLEAMAASANATPLVTGQGLVTITRAVTSAAVATLDRSGRTKPRVTDWKSAAPQTPVWRLTARVARPASVVDLKDVNYVDDIIDRGAWAVGTVYRAGNVVWLANKSSWLYTNATPTAGNAPPVWPVESNAYWQNLTPPAQASDLTYADGTPIENLKPAEAGATLGATTGVNLKDSGSQVLTDSAIKNVNVTISAGGALSGGGGGQVTIGGLGYLGDLTATNSENLIPNGYMATGRENWALVGTVGAWTAASAGDPIPAYVRYIAGVDYTSYGQRSHNEVAGFAVRPGEQIKLDCFIRGDLLNSNSCRVTARLRFYTAAHVLISSPALVIQVTGSLNTWEQRREITNASWVAPDTAAYARFEFFGIVVSPATYVDFGGIRVSRVAEGATKNTVTRAAAAPSSPTDGDIWVDTSVTPNKIKTRIAGAWQESASLNVGLLADMSAVDLGTSFATGTLPTSKAVAGLINTSITISGVNLNGIGTGAGTAVANPGITLGANGALSGAGGGQVTYSGIGGKALGLLDDIALTDAKLTGELPPSKTQDQNSVNLYRNEDLADLTYQPLPFGWSQSTEAIVTNSAKMNSVRAFKTVPGNGTTSQSQTVSDTAAAYRPRVEPSKRYRLNCVMAATAGFTGQTLFALRFFRADGTNIAGSDVNIFGNDYRTTAAAAETIQSLVGEGVAPADAHSVFVRMTVLWSTTQNNAGFGYFSKPRLTRLPSLGATGEIRDESGNALTDTGTFGVKNSGITISGTSLNGIGTGAGTAVANSGVSIATNGALSGAGGGQVTIGGLGYSGDLDAQRLSRLNVTSGKLLRDTTEISAEFLANSYVALGVDASGTGGRARVRLTRDNGTGFTNYELPSVAQNLDITLSGVNLNGIGTGNGTAVANSGITLGSNGALSGAGGGQVVFAQMAPTESAKLAMVEEGASTSDNTIRNALLTNDAGGWTFSNATMTRVVAAATDPVPAFIRSTAAAGNDAASNNGMTSDVSPVANMTPFHGGQKVYCSFIYRTDGSRRVQLLFRGRRADNTAPGGSTVVDVTANTAGAWVFVKATFTIPADVVKGAFRIVMPGSANGTYTDAAALRVAPTEFNSTVGATAGTDLRDSGSQVLTDSAIKNVNVTISSSGALAGGGGGQVTIGGLGYSGALDATKNIVSRSDAWGGGAPGDINFRETSHIIARANIGGTIYDFATYGARAGSGSDRTLFDENMVKLTNSGSTGVRNNVVTIAANGALAGAGGGQVTPTGMGLEDAADVTKAITGAKTLEVNYASDGSTVTTSLPLTALLKLESSGGTIYSSGVTWAVSTVTGSWSGTAPSISGTGSGQLSINSGPASPTVILKVTATHSGRVYTYTVEVKKVVADPSSGGGGGETTVTDTTLSVFFTTSFAAISDELVIPSIAGTQVSLSVGSTQLQLASESPGGSTSVEFKWQWWNGSAWADVGTATTSSPHPTVEQEGTFYTALPGSITCVQTKTGLTAGTSNKFRLMARCSAGNTRTVTPNGTASATG
jgi:hypothetical protein